MSPFLNTIIRSLAATFVERRPTRNANQPPRRGRFERFEARHLLSATSAATDVEAALPGATGHWHEERPFADVSEEPMFAHRAVYAQVIGASTAPSFDGAFGDFPRADFGRPPLSGWRYEVIIVFWNWDQSGLRGAFGAGERSLKGTSPLAGSLPPSDGDALLRSQAPASTLPAINNSFEQFISTGAAGIYDWRQQWSALATFDDTFDSTGSFANDASSSNLADRVQDAVFQDYAADWQFSPTSQRRRKLIESDLTEESIAVSNGGLWAEFDLLDGLESLDQSQLSSEILERELDAIDHVMRELHEVPSRQSVVESPLGDFAEAGSHDATTQVLRQLRDQAHDDGQPPEFEEGGMVLLQISSNPDDWALDLTGANYVSLRGILDPPPRIEASIGLYQAFDVSTGETSPASVEPTTSTNDRLRKAETADEATSREQKPVS